MLCQVMQGKYCRVDALPKLRIENLVAPLKAKTGKTWHPSIYVDYILLFHPEFHNKPMVVVN